MMFGTMMSGARMTEAGGAFDSATAPSGGAAATARLVGNSSVAVPREDQNAERPARREAGMENAAHQFEASLMQELFKPLEKEPLFSEDGSDSEDKSNPLGSFAGEAMARAVSDRGGFGIARQIIQHFQKNEMKSKADGPVRSSFPSS